jgi:integrase
MPKKIEELTPVALNRKADKLKKAKTQGLIAVGGVPGLHLQVSAAGATTWILRFTAGVKPGTGKAWRRDLGLGGYPAVGLSQAREKAREARDKIAQGIDPITEKREQRSAMIAARLAEITFEEAAKQFIASQSVTWKAGGKSEHQWSTSLEDYAYPVVGSLRVADIELAHILKVLEPIWTTKTETARRIRSRLEQVLDWATIRGYRKGDNPARWRGALDKVLPAPDKVRKVKHHAALAIAELPDFLTQLRQRNGIGAKALEFAILTAARSGEARGATWDEIDLEAKVWTIPAERMKASKEHRVPLSADAVKLLKGLPHMEGTDLVFAPPRGTNPLSDNTLTKVLKDMGVPVTAHGFRSTFRDWCAEHTEFPREVAEMALAHSIGNAVEAAYRRGDLFDKRRELMSKWASYCAGKSKA